MNLTKHQDALVCVRIWAWVVWFARREAAGVSPWAPPSNPAGARLCMLGTMSAVTPPDVTKSVPSVLAHFDSHVPKLAAGKQGHRRESFRPARPHREADPAKSVFQTKSSKERPKLLTCHAGKEERTTAAVGALAHESAAPIVRGSSTRRKNLASSNLSDNWNCPKSGFSTSRMLSQRPSALFICHGEVSRHFRCRTTTIFLRVLRFVDCHTPMADSN